jgi:KUP system potassium uptake protein
MARALALGEVERERAAAAVKRWERLFAAMHLNANLPAAYFGVPTAQVVEVGLEVEI